MILDHGFFQCSKTCRKDWIVVFTLHVDIYLVGLIDAAGYDELQKLHG
jgi:hypothetical protein